jgi:translation initiation factor 3 subunit E
MADLTISEFDLLPKLVTRLDRHLIFPLLEFSSGQLENEDGSVKDEAKTQELLKAKYELLKKTNMTDYVANLYCDMEGLQDPPKEFADKRQKVIETLEKYEESTSKITELLQREDVVTNLRSDKVANLEFLKKDHEVCCHPVVARCTLAGDADRHWTRDEMLIRIRLR